MNATRAAIAAVLAAFAFPCFAEGGANTIPSCAAGAEQLTGLDLLPVFLKHHGNVTLSPEEGCLQLGDPPRALAAVRLVLPAFEGPYAVRITAPVSKEMLLPRVILLDDQYHATRSFGAESLKRRGTQMSLEIFIDPPNAAEKYVLIYPDPAHIGDTDRRTTSKRGVMFVGTGVIFTGSDVGDDVVAEATGDLTVSLVGERFEKMRERR